MQKFTYIKNFLKDKKVGAVAKSSKFAVSKISESVDGLKDVTIVEYGPGDGVLTRALLEKISGDSRIIAIETNISFVKQLSRINDKRLTVINDYAEHLPSVLKRLGISSVDYVFSGIPFSFLKKDTRFQIVKNTKDALRSGGEFVVYQYSPLMATYMKRVFGNVRVRFIPFNIPSYFLMEARKR